MLIYHTAIPLAAGGPNAALSLFIGSVGRLGRGQTEWLINMNSYLFISLIILFTNIHFRSAEFSDGAKDKYRSRDIMQKARRAREPCSVTMLVIFPLDLAPLERNLAGKFIMQRKTIF